MIDIVLGIGFVAAALAGWFQGFIRQLVGLALMVAGAAAAFYLRGPVGALVKPFMSKQSPEAVDMVAAAVTFLAVVIVGNIVAGFFYKRVPFLAHRNLLDEALGAAFSVGLRVVELSIVLIILDAFYRTTAILPASGFGLLDSINGLLKDSVIAGFLRDTTVPLILTLVGPLIPAAYRSLLDLPKH